MSTVATSGWFLLVLFFFFTIALGAILRERVKTSLDFQLAGRSMPAWVAVVSFALSGLSMLEFLAMGAAGAAYGFAAAGFFAAGSAIAMLATGAFIAPRLRTTGLRTLSAYIGQQQGEPTRRLHTGLFLLSTIIATSLSLAVFARLVQTLHLLDVYFLSNHWPVKNIFPATVLFVAVLAALYVLLAGLAGTMANHVLQTLVLLAGTLTALWFGLHHVSGYSKFGTVLSDALAGSGAANPQNSLLLLLAGIVLGAAFWCADPRALQITLAAKNSAQARRTPLLAAPLRLVLALLFVSGGIVALVQPTPQIISTSKVVDGAIYRQTIVVPPDAAAGQGLVPAQLDANGAPRHDAAGRTLLDGGRATPTLLLRRIPVKLQGLALGALFAALLCGLATSLSAIGSAFVQDLSIPRAPAIDEVAAEIKKLALCRRVTAGAAVAIAALALAWGFAPAVGTQNVFALVVLLAAVFGVPALATLLLALFAPRLRGCASFAGLFAAQLAALLVYGITLPEGATRGLLGGFLYAGCRTNSVLEQSLCIAAAALLAHGAVSLLLSLLAPARTSIES